MNRSHSFTEPAPTVIFSDTPPDIVQPVQVVRAQVRAMAGTEQPANIQVLFSEVPPDVTQPVQIVATAKSMSAPLTPVPDLATTIAELRATGVADEEMRKFLKEIGSSHAFALAGPQKAVRVTLPGGHMLEPWKSKLLLSVLGAQMTLFMGPGILTFLELLPATADRLGITIGIGPTFGASGIASLSLGAGILFAPGYRVGFFGSIDGALGFTAGVSATMGVTIVHGGPELFSGAGYAASIGGGEGVVGSVTALYDENRNFIGVTFAMGIGAGLTPIEVQAGTQLGKITLD